MKKGERQVAIDDFTEEDKVENEGLNLWDYKAEKEIVGFVVEVSSGSYNGQKIGLQTETSEEVVYIPELSALNTQLSKVVVGDKVKLVYKGQEKAKKSGRYYEIFDVFIKHQN